MPQISAVNKGREMEQKDAKSAKGWEDLVPTSRYGC
jgi:hypothetical protein